MCRCEGNRRQLRCPTVKRGTSGAHAPDEFMLIESNNPQVAGLREATMGYVDFLHEMATIR